jgi:hypothetical protein
VPFDPLLDTRERQRDGTDVVEGGHETIIVAAPARRQT